MAYYFGSLKSLFSNFPYKKFKLYLVTYGIISYEEKKLIDRHREEYKIQSVLGNIQSSLFRNQPKPFKSFLELVEESGDHNLKEAAKKCG